MSRSAQIDPAIEELVRSRIPIEKLRQLAARLDLPFERVGKYAATKGKHDSDADFIRKLVCSAIRAAVDGGDASHERLEELARIRTFFETVMAWNVMLEPLSTRRILSQLSRIQVKMRRILDSRGFDSDAAIELWKLDGEFHRAICHEAGFNNLGEIVDDVLRECQKIGTASDLTAAEDTLSEHALIIDAIAHSDDDGAFYAVHNHVGQTYLRWCAKEGTTLGEMLNDSHLSMLLSQDRFPLYEASENAFFRALPDLVQSSAGRWVAFQGEQLVACGSTKRAVYKKVLKQNLRHGEYTIRLVDPDLLHDEPRQMG